MKIVADIQFRYILENSHRIGGGVYLRFFDFDRRMVKKPHYFSYAAKSFFVKSVNFKKINVISASLRLILCEICYII